MNNGKNTMSEAMLDRGAKEEIKPYNRMAWQVLVKLREDVSGCMRSRSKARGDLSFYWLNNGIHIISLKAVTVEQTTTSRSWLTLLSSCRFTIQKEWSMQIPKAFLISFPSHLGGSLDYHYKHNCLSASLKVLDSMLIWRNNSLMMDCNLKWE